MIDAILDAIEHWIENPLDFVDDSLGAVCLTLIFWGLMFLPLIVE